MKTINFQFTYDGHTYKKNFSGDERFLFTLKHCIDGMLLRMKIIGLLEEKMKVTISKENEVL